MIRRAAITGWPVGHSRSPLIHGFWLDRYRIEGSYDRVPVAPQDAENFYRNLKGSGLVGCNVTVPHKEVAYHCCDWLDPAAQAIQAVNTLWLEQDGNRICGANTDGLGFLGNLDQGAPGWDRSPGPALVLGAGGAARAAIWALLSRNFAPVYIANRTVSKAEILSAHFGSDSKAISLDSLSTILGELALLVNTTSLGMAGQPPLDLDLEELSLTALVTDAVYSPLETELLRWARARGNPTVDGLGMLLHQAAPAFERWFGVLPEVTVELRDLILADLGIAK